MADESEIIEIENKRANAELHGDLPFFFSLLSSEFVATNPFNKIINRDQVIEIFEKGIAGDVSLFDIEIDKISFVNGLAVVMGQETLMPKGISLHAGKTITRRFTNVWIKKEEGWKITARQATNISIV
jgi:uncharacterized protein DUF4440